MPPKIPTKPSNSVRTMLIWGPTAKRSATGQLTTWRPRSSASNRASAT